MQIKWVVGYSYYCSDSGRHYKVITFNTKREAYSYYKKWKEAAHNGRSWSDGYDWMSEPKKEYTYIQ